MLDALFAAAAEAVFSYILDTLEPAERLSDWLKRNPVRLAYQHALARTYAAFARQYPELTASLFNESFLTIEAAPELAKFLTRHQHPDHTQIVRLWAKSITPQTETGQQSVEALSKREDLNLASAYFVELLTSELKHESALQPLFDSRALESLPAIEAKLDTLTIALESNFKRALAIANSYQQTVVNHYEQTITNRIGGVDFQAQDVTIGGDVVGRDKVVSNTYNTYFTGGFETLDDLYVRPDAVFQRVRVQDFVGREWLTAKVDAFLNNEKRKSGVFLLVGEAGVGKTSFMAHLVTERRYVHLFAEQVPGDVNVSRALQSLGAQLVARYQIDPYKEKGTLPAIATFPDFLDKLLRLAADKLSAGEKIVIVCDALDEAGTAPNGNVFGLPSVLPDGVYFILSQRPVTVKLAVKTDLIKEIIDAAGADNLHDVAQYLTAVAHRPEVFHQLRAHHYTEADFVRVLKERSGGVWMYLFYIVSEIAAGSRAPLDLATLPSGLAGYYTDYWGDWCEGRRARGDGPTKWDAVYAPLLATLAAAQLPVNLKLLLAWSNVQTTDYEVERLLRRNWRAFITEREIDHTPHFALYHASLRDFLTGQVDRQGLTLEAEQLIDELSRRTRDAHAHIVAAYRHQCNDDWVKLAEDDYARTHLCLHLSASGDDETMFQLVAMTNAWAEAKYAKEESYANYLIDLNRAWRYSEAQPPSNMGRQIRCALIKSSIHSLASSIPPYMLRHLVEAHVWSPARALLHIPQILDEHIRADSLSQIARLLPDELKAQAVATARAIEDEQYRTQALAALAQQLPIPLKFEVLTEALASLSAIRPERTRARILTRLARRLPDCLKADVLEVACAIHDERIRARVLVTLTSMLSDTLKADVLAAVRAIHDEEHRARALAALLPRLPDPLKAEALTDAVASARAIEDEELRARSLASLAPILPDSLKTEVLTEALTAAREIKDTEYRAHTLAILIRWLPHPLRSEASSLALASALGIPNEEYKAQALCTLARRLPKPLKVDLLAAVRALYDEDNRAQALVALAPTLPDPLKADALAATLAIRDEEYRAQAMVALARVLPAPLVPEMLAAVRAFEFERFRMMILTALSPRLPDSLKAEALGEVRAMQHEGYQALALEALIPVLTDPLKAEMIVAARTFEVEQIRAFVLSALARTFPEPLKTELLIEALTVVCAIENEKHRARALVDLASWLPDLSKADFFKAARTIHDNVDRARVLAAIALGPPHPLKAEALTEVLSVVHIIYDVQHWAGIFSDLALMLPQSMKEEALKLRQRIDSLPNTKQLPNVQYRLLWPESLRTLAQDSRGELLDDLAALVPLIENLGGQAAIEEFFYALRDVTTWWP